MKEGPELKTSALGKNTEKVASAIRKQSPEESEELGFWGSLFDGEYSEYLEAAKLVPGFVPTQDELCLLAEHYLNTAVNRDYWWELARQSGGGAEQTFAYRRLDAIRKLVGEEVVDRALSRTKEEWKRTFEELAALPRCQRCGVKHGPDSCPASDQ